MSAKHSIQAQATAVERALVNWRGHRDTIARLVANGKRPAHELAALEQWIPQLAAAVVTVRWLACHEAEIKAALARPSA
jgi:hypothetical protein